MIVANVVLIPYSCRTLKWCFVCSVYYSVYYSVCSVQRSGLYVCTRQVHIQDMFDDEWQERLKNCPLCIFIFIKREDEDEEGTGSGHDRKKGHRLIDNGPFFFCGFSILWSTVDLDYLRVEGGKEEEKREEEEEEEVEMGKVKWDSSVGWSVGMVR